MSSLQNMQSALTEYATFTHIALYKKHKQHKQLKL